MKNIKRIVSICMCAVLALSMLSGCGKKAGSETKELNFWYTSDYESGKPEEQWSVNQYARQFEQENPGVKINILFQEDQDVAMGKLKAAVQAGTAPDIAQLYSGYALKQFEDILADITTLIPEADKNALLGWETASKDMELGNKIYGYPASGSELGIFLYNKELVAKAGVDLEGEGRPKNAQEFKAALAKIKESGTLPIIAQSKGLNELWIWGTGAWWPQVSGISAPMSDSTAKTKFADDKGFIEALDFTATFVADGLVNEDYSTTTEARSRFFNGEGALYPCGSWALGAAKEAMGGNLGVFCAPSYDGKVDDITMGGIGQTWAVLESSKNKELAVKFLSYISSKDYVIKQTGLQGNAPKRNDITAQEIGWAGDPVYEKVLEYSKKVILWSDNALQTDVANEYYTRTGMVVYGQISAAECAQQLDEIAAQAAGK